jgi:alginate O-acetyltransferase complex protein AlgI
VPIAPGGTEHAVSLNEPTFLFLFLPVLLLLYHAIPRWWAAGPGLRNAVLLLASVVFYFWGGKQFLGVLIGAVLFNYLTAMAIERCHDTPAARRFLGLGVGANLALLVAFKYWRFIAANIAGLLGAPQVLAKSTPAEPPLLIPLGLSFFTFSAIGYLVDVYGKRIPAERNLWRTSLYLLLFPKIVAGPITRYQQLSRQLADRPVTPGLFASGVQRFIIGLAKKTIIASAVGLPADRIFAIPTAQLTPPLAWLGLVCYAIQIYFDFSGYTDMAIGTGRMFGFNLPENFDYPYVADSIRDFWRRWHISLSSWLRDYLYVPLGGNRVAPWRVYFNLVTVFVLCGVWHGASWSYIVWGLYFGVFLVLERLGLGDALQKAPRPVRHLYTLTVVLGSWVLFRAATLGDAIGYFGALAGVSGGAGVTDGVGVYVDRMVVLAVVAGVIGSI